MTVSFICVMTVTHFKSERQLKTVNTERENSQFKYFIDGRIINLPKINSKGSVKNYILNEDTVDMKNHIV